MRAAIATLAAMWFALPLAGADNPKSAAPSYTASSIVHAASFQPGILVPNGLATIYGTELAFSTRALAPGDLRGDDLPETLPGSGVSVIVNGIWAHVIYASPGQINFLVPANLAAGNATVTVVRSGVSGNAANVRVAAAQPGMFLLDAATAVATHADGSVVTKTAPGQPGDTIVLYATGLGQTNPAAFYGKLARAAAQVERISAFRVVIDGRTLDGGILYAGVTPGFAGLYQINVRLPEWTGPNPEIRLMIDDAASPPGIRIPVATGPASAASTQ